MGFFHHDILLATPPLAIATVFFCHYFGSAQPVIMLTIAQPPGLLMSSIPSSGNTANTPLDASFSVAVLSLSCPLMPSQCVCRVFFSHDPSVLTRHMQTCTVFKNIN
jgi:hypothetical protein